MIPENNDLFWGICPDFGLLHLFIVERVRGIEKNCSACYISNEQLARETNTSISTVSRAIGLLADEGVLIPYYHTVDRTNRQRILRISDFPYEEACQNKQEIVVTKVNSSKIDCQTEKLTSASCLSDVSKMTSLDAQNASLVYKSISKENNQNINYSQNSSCGISIDCEKESGSWDDVVYSEMVDIGDVSTLYQEGCQKKEHEEVKLGSRKAEGTENHISEEDCFAWMEEEEYVSKENPKEDTTPGIGTEVNRLKAPEEDIATDLDDYFSLPHNTQDEILEDLYLGLLTEEDTPLWATMYWEIVDRFTKGDSIDDMRPFFRDTILGNARRELEDQLRNQYTENSKQ